MMRKTKSYWDPLEEVSYYTYTLPSFLFIKKIYEIKDISSRQLHWGEESKILARVEYIEKKTQKEVCIDCVVRSCCTKMCEKFELTVSYCLRQEIDSFLNIVPI